MKKWHSIISLILLFSYLGYSQNTSELKPKQFLQVMGFAGAGVILHSDGGPNFSGGAGLRFTNYINEKIGFVIGGEYNYRGAYWKLHYLDLKATAIIGNKFFSELGFYGSSILASKASDFDWDNNSTIDFGGVYAIGYNFNNGITAGVNVHFGLVDLSEDRLPIGGGAYIINQTNLHWGAFFAFKILGK